ncbi:MAG: zf-HC2 domain-containing protein, partial [Calditrichaceae bacterium]
MMDCNYILQNDIHEKYLKNELGPEEESDYLAHLKTCTVCRQALENEKIFLEGIRHAGHAEMKREIESQVAKLKSTHSGADWTLVFKVAAVLFFLVIMPGTLYFYNTDIFKHETGQTGAVDTTGVDAVEYGKNGSAVEKEKETVQPELQNTYPKETEMADAEDRDKSVLDESKTLGGRDASKSRRQVSVKRAEPVSSAESGGGIRTEKQSVSG